ncbi:MAG TPA: lipid-A-disaccharide synthase [Chthoniobacterales bacterium]|nr:lipid-A-disaccharide synthase [Chthoniobacterales bacterium]
MSKRLYFVAGEASGDQHGAALLKALREIRPELEFVGRGGPRMKEIAGEGFMNWSDAAAVVGLWEVVKRYGYFREQFRDALGEIADLNPDAVILIDYPGFNLRLARTLRRRAPNLKIIYYISPQVWAWNRGRIRQMARYLDLMLCIFPFEAELYNQSGLRTVFVGHPMIENLAARRADEARQPNLVGLFPGSRLREVRKIFPIMLEAARELAAGNQQVQFEVAAASESLALEIRRMLAASSVNERARIVVGDAAGTMQRASAGMVASGTATLEAAYFRLPFVLVYKVSWPTYFAARLVIKTEHLGMPNVLAGREIVPEFVQHQARPARIAEAIAKLLSDRAARDLMTLEFDAIIAKLGESGASEKAARTIIDELT